MIKKVLTLLTGFQNNHSTQHSPKHDWELGKKNIKANM